MALGRGLGEILSEVEEAYEKDIGDIDSFEFEAQGARVEKIDLTKITPNPYQPRKYFDEKALKELSDSIKEHGLLQPIVVIEKEDGYILVAGERRFRAHKLAKLATIKAIIADVSIDEIRLRELALIENIQREDLNPIELANSYAELINVHNITHDELSAIVHKSRSQITNTMRLLTLSPHTQEQLISGKITQGHAKVLVGLESEKERVVLDSIIGQKLSVRDTENIVKSYRSSSSGKNASATRKSLLDTYIKEIKMMLPFRYKIKAKSIEINFRNEEEVKNFLAILKKE